MHATTAGSHGTAALLRAAAALAEWLCEWGRCAGAVALDVAVAGCSSVEAAGLKVGLCACVLLPVRSSCMLQKPPAVVRRLGRGLRGGSGSCVQVRCVL